MNVAESLVSVTVLAFNHGKYIGQAIQSVLDQTHRNLEVVVVNDGSTDDTADVLNRLADPRVRVFHQANLGPSVAANRALSECRGKYVAIMAGDDLLPPQRIERQLAEYLKGGSRVLFSQFDMIDEDGAPTQTNWYDSNRTPAYGRAKVLRRLFDGSAPAMILTLFSETRVLRAEQPYCNPALYQLQDYDLQIRLAKKYEFSYLNEPLYHYRMRRGHINLSGSDPLKLIRTRNEFYLLMRPFFDDIPMELFKEMFPDLVRNPAFVTEPEYKCEQAFVWLKSPIDTLRLLGVEKLYDLLQDTEARHLLSRTYAFTHKTFANTTKVLDVLRDYPDQSHIFIETEGEFPGQKQLSCPSNTTHEGFTLHYDLSGVGRVRSVRWQPVEGRYSKVRVEDISVWDAAGRTASVDLDRIASNGQQLAERIHLFLTPEPMFSLPIEGDIAGIAIKGRWWNHLGGKGECHRRSTLYPDDGRNFREEIAINRKVYLEVENFSLTFCLSEVGPVRSLRWDPVEDCFCAVRLEAVTYVDASGGNHSLDPCRITSNGILLASGAYLFETTDPMFFLPIEGNIRMVTVHGRWWGPLAPAEVEQQKACQRMANEGSSRWLRQLVKGGVRKLRKLKRRTFAE